MANSTEDYLQVIARRRGKAVVVTTMTASKVWPRWSETSADIDYLPSAMSHASDLALGIALSNSRRMVLCLNGDGSLLMNMGTLATTAAARASNLVMFVMANDIYRIVGGSPIPAAGAIQWDQLATACGWPSTSHVRSAAELDARWPSLVTASGPTLVWLDVDDPPNLPQQLPRRHPGAALREFRASVLSDAGG